MEEKAQEKKKSQIGDQYEALIEVSDKKADLKKRFSVRVYVLWVGEIWRVRAKGTL
jgi:hypothetical protein